MSKNKESMQKEIDENYDAFVRLLPELIKTDMGRYVIMRNKKQVRIFDTFRDAILYAEDAYEDGLYSVQEITQRPVDLGWFSHATIPVSV